MPTPDKYQALSDELFQYRPSDMDALGVFFSMACVCCNSMGLTKLEAQRLFVELWDEGAKDQEIAAYKKQRMEDLGITDQDIAETAPPKP